MTAPIIGPGAQQSVRSVWFLAGQVSPTSPIRHIPVHGSSFRVGRRGEHPLCLPHPTISGSHAEFVDDGDRLRLRDLGSTNGTFVNGQRITGFVAVNEDDLIQFADLAFRLRRQSADTAVRTVHENALDSALALVQFDKMMSERAVVPFYQPIIRMSDGGIIGYEVLGRSKVFGLETPRAMFQAASQLDLEIELSCMCRWEGVRLGMDLGDSVHLFLNTHPLELRTPGLETSIRALRDLAPHLEITLEIHEAAVTEPASMASLRDALREMQIHLAYDDFGAGQARLVELTEVPPDFLKFDIDLIRNIDNAASSRRQMLATFVRMTRELGITPLAEGVETEAEHTTCLELGFELGQGFLYGKPAPVSACSFPPRCGIVT